MIACSALSPDAPPRRRADPYLRGAKHLVARMAADMLAVLAERGSDAHIDREDSVRFGWSPQQIDAYGFAALRQALGRTPAVILAIGDDDPETRSRAVVETTDAPPTAAIDLDEETIDPVVPAPAGVRPALLAAFERLADTFEDVSNTYRGLAERTARAIAELRAELETGGDA